MGDELDSPGRQQLKSFDLEGEVGEVSGNGKLQKEERPQGVIREKDFGVARVDEDAAED